MHPLKKLSIGIFGTLLSLSLISCNAKPQPLSAAEIPLTGESVMGSVEGEEYRYFRYPSVEAALVDKAKISADARTIAGEKFTWEGPVHVYHLAKRIVIYVGDTPNVLALIEQIFGPQIAGDLPSKPAGEESQSSVTE
ncbi:MAG TPA: hypothetical protein VJB82_00060 [Candidatus Peribacterales bacterium]|nr:hypothetical protein [Candidatus Peribacterales bacterium]